MWVVVNADDESRVGAVVNDVITVNESHMDEDALLLMLVPVRQPPSTPPRSVWSLPLHLTYLETFNYILEIFSCFFFQVFEGF